VPELPWYRTTIPQMAIAGFLPFSAIYVELYYIFASVWGHKVGCVPSATHAEVNVQKPRASESLARACSCQLTHGLAHHWPSSYFHTLLC